VDLIEPDLCIGSWRFRDHRMREMQMVMIMIVAVVMFLCGKTGPGEYE
jgi:hypothetical protein